VSNFFNRIQELATQGSGISPALWSSCTQYLTNQKIEAGNEVTHPLYDVLHWHFPRFGHKANEQAKELGVALIDHHGATWQVIKEDVSDSRGYRYVAPKGIGNRVFFPPLDDETIVKICDRNGVNLPSYEEWLDGGWSDPLDFFHAQRIPLTVTEGAKKALAGLSEGYLVAAVYGKDCLHSPDLIRWCEGGRTIRIALDQDTGFNSKGESKAANTRRSVAWGAKHLQGQGAIVELIEWDPAVAKGLDDLLIADRDSFHRAMSNPVPVQSGAALEETIVRESILKPFGNRPYDAVIPASEFAQFVLDHPNVDMFFDGETGCRKTDGIIDAIGTNPNVLYTAPSRSLTRGIQSKVSGRVCCIPSLYKERSIPEIFVVEEVDQVHLTLAIGGNNENHREDNGKEYKAKLKHSQVISSSATARLEDLELQEALSGRRFLLVKVLPSHGFKKGKITVHHANPNIKGTWTAARQAVLDVIRSTIQDGNRCLNFFDHGIDSNIHKEIKDAIGLLDENIMPITGENQDDPRVESFLGSSEKGQWVDSHNVIRGFNFNSAMPSGTSIVDPKGVKLFPEFVGIVSGDTISAGMVTQGVFRYRSSDCNRSIAVSLTGKYNRPVGDKHRGARGRGKGRILDGIHKNQLDRESLITSSTGIGFGFMDGEITAYGRALDHRLYRESRHFKTATIAYLERDGWEVVTVQHDRPGVSNIDRAAVKLEKAMRIVEARAIGEREYLGLKSTPELSRLALKQIEAYEIRQFLGLPWDAELTPEQVISEGFGKGRKQLKNLLRITIAGQALADDRAVADRLGSQIHSRDMSNHAASLNAHTALGNDEILAYALSKSEGEGYHTGDPVLREWWDKLRQYQDVSHSQPRLLGFTLPYIAPGDYSQMVSTLGQILNSKGFRTANTKKTIDGEQVRVYHVTQESIAKVTGQILETIATDGVELLVTPLTKVLMGGVTKLIDSSLKEAIETEDIPKIEYFSKLTDTVTPLFAQIREPIAA